MFAKLQEIELKGKWIYRFFMSCFEIRLILILSNPIYIKIALVI